MPARWYAFALAVPLLIVAAQTVAAAVLGLPLVFGEQPARLPAAIAVLVFLAGGGQEGPGWRGFLLPALQARMTPLAPAS